MLPFSRSTTKTITIFVIGTILGFGVANLLIHVNNYLLNQKASLEDAIYGEELKKMNQVRLLCWVMTKPSNHETLARSIQLTWGKRCNVLLFFSSVEDKSFPTIGLSFQGHEDRPNLWIKTRQAWRYVWNNYGGKADWFLKVDDDTFVVVENLKHILSAYNSSKPVVLGRKLEYALSREATKRLVEQGLENEASKCQKGDYEDAEMAKCLENLNVKTIKTLDDFGREQFLSHGLQNILTLSDPNNKIANSQLINELNCCSHSAVSFQSVSYTRMFRYHYFIYHVKVPGRYGRKLLDGPSIN